MTEYLLKNSSVHYTVMKVIEYMKILWNHSVLYLLMTEISLVPLSILPVWYIFFLGTPWYFLCVMTEVTLEPLCTFPVWWQNLLWNPSVLSLCDDIGCFGTPRCFTCWWQSRQRRCLYTAWAQDDTPAAETHTWRGQRWTDTRHLLGGRTAKSHLIKIETNKSMLI